MASGEPLRLIHILKPEPDLKGHEQFDAEGGRIGAFMAHFMKAARIDMQYQTNFIAQSDDPAELTPSV